LDADILLVDDMPDLRRAIARMLRLVGHRVVEAASAGEGFALMRADPLPDVAITDVMMPEMDGIEMLQAMRADPRMARVPVIMFSAVNDSRRIAAALAEGRGRIGSRAMLIRRRCSPRSPA
jgi:CheY-like chemotaxis protein